VAGVEEVVFVDAAGARTGRRILAGERLGLLYFAAASGPSGFSPILAGSAFGAEYGTILGNHVSGSQAYNVEANVELLMQGTVEPDADGDLYGDESQDSCSSGFGAADVHVGPCPSPPQPAAAVPPGAGADDAAPLVTFSGRAVQRLKRGAVVVEVQTNEPARLDGKGEVATPRLAKRPAKLSAAVGKRAIYPLQRASADADALSSVRLRLKLTKKALTAAKAALKGGQRSTARIHITATDSASNKREATRTIRLTK